MLDIWWTSRPVVDTGARLGTLPVVRCRRCGHENEVGANYCSSCGTPLTGDDETTLSLAALEDRQALEEELGASLDELPAGMGLLVVRRGPNAGQHLRPRPHGARRSGATPSRTSSSTT